LYHGGIANPKMIYLEIRVGQYDIISPILPNSSERQRGILTRIAEIQTLVRYGLYYLTEHADDEAIVDGFDIYDVENGILTGKVRKTWPQDDKFEVVGKAFDGRTIGVVCRITSTVKVRVITVYEDNPKK